MIEMPYHDYLIPSNLVILSHSTAVASVAHHWPVLLLTQSELGGKVQRLVAVNNTWMCGEMATTDSWCFILVFY